MSFIIRKAENEDKIARGNRLVPFFNVVTKEKSKNLDIKKPPM